MPSKTTEAASWNPKVHKPLTSAKIKKFNKTLTYLNFSMIERAPQLRAGQFLTLVLKESPYTRQIFLSIDKSLLDNYQLFLPSALALLFLN
jgi:hypothetical protein